MAGVYEINLQVLPPHEATALVLTALAYPQFSELDTEVDQRFGEIAALIVRRRSQADPSWANELQALRPSHLLIPELRINTAEKKLKALLSQRLEAGRMAVAFVNHEVEGAHARLPDGVPRLSQNAMAEFVAGDNDNSIASNIKTRSFRPSLPVMHMCVALAWMRVLMAQHSGYASVVDGLMSNMNLLRAFVLMAQNFEAPVLRSKHIPIDSEQLVRLRWIDNQVQNEVAA